MFTICGELREIFTRLPSPDLLNASQHELTQNRNESINNIVEMPEKSIM